MTYQQYNVALIPSEAVGIQAIEMSRMLVDQGGVFTLNSTNAYPHVSLYHVPLDPTKEEEVIEMLREALSHIQSAPLKQIGYRSSERGFVSVGYEKDEYILELHRSMLQALAPLWVKEIIETAKEEALSKEQQESLEQYGWKAAEDLFDPHLTFSRLVQPNPEVVSELKPQNFSFVSDLVGLFELGEHGTCTRCLAIFELPKK
ncbi:MAG: hypothetical protein KBC83_03695 [Candidatus Moranbacteria bacterium]|jgi:2'-5' RNA ligase|nr:hypothetical protein [Candidatus Moranbacteria bacterium]MBP9801739.1 hypothetical protein [Candidatus Moranbacteria bacterium]